MTNQRAKCCFRLLIKGLDTGDPYCWFKCRRQVVSSALCSALTVMTKIGAWYSIVGVLAGVAAFGLSNGKLSFYYHYWQIHWCCGRQERIDPRVQKVYLR